LSRMRWSRDILRRARAFGARAAAACSTTGRLEATPRMFGGVAV
jgi:hypothetical protein